MDIRFADPRGGLTQFGVGEAGQFLLELLPKFFYFSNYELLPGECNIVTLVERQCADSLEEGDETMLALLQLAGEGADDLLDEDYESREAELQAASMELSDQVFRYWKQNDALSVVMATDMPVVRTDPNTSQEVRERVLKIELHDERNDVKTNFALRSAGFRWFFSFLAAFSAYQDHPERTVVLLDEPGLSLHGEAQGDFLRYVFDELGTHQQVLYTTHSQHMIDPTRYETMRAIHDRATRQNPELGVVITPVSLSADRTTILPVESALGYSVAQHLFLGAGPHLAVEGSSDFMFLLRMSEHLRPQGRAALDPRIAIIPVGGIGTMPAFVAVMGRRMHVRALIDGAHTASVAKKVYGAAAAVGVDEKHIVVLGNLDGLPHTADIEDLFTTKDYLWLYNRSVDRPLQAAELPDTPQPILQRLQVARERDGLPGTFDHAGLAHQLTVYQQEFFVQADPDTLNRFEALFRELAVD
ncbi:putative AbiEii toxin of type IV toxin-antitoxin system [Streptomyces sp. SLBN-118]|nr:putative AbiEii toxin of type IV toxin-antitoxin system [Streptomyces sp. SLBN-118]